MTFLALPQRLWMSFVDKRTRKRAKLRKNLIISILAGGQGFEPRQAESESAVLPLDDPPAYRNDATKIEKSAYYVKGKS